MCGAMYASGMIEDHRTLTAMRLKGQAKGAQRRTRAADVLAVAGDAGVAPQENIRAATSARPVLQLYT